MFLGRDSRETRGNVQTGENPGVVNLRPDSFSH